MPHLLAGRSRAERRSKRPWTDAIKADLKLTAVKGDFTLKPHSKFKRATAWLSDDQDRLLLKVEAEVFVGSYGLLAIGGLIAMAIGGLLLTNTSNPNFQVSRWLVLLIPAFVGNPGSPG